MPLGNLVFLGLRWPWDGEFVGFMLIFTPSTCFPNRIWYIANTLLHLSRWTGDLGSALQNVIHTKTRYNQTCFCAPCDTEQIYTRMMRRWVHTKPRYSIYFVSSTKSRQKNAFFCLLQAMLKDQEETQHQNQLQSLL